MKRFFAASILLASTFATPAGAADVTIHGAWARATAPQVKTGAVYLELNATTDDALVGAASPVADSVAVHETVKSGTTAGMRPVTSLPVSAAKTTRLAPGGYHIMLMGLKQRLVEGESFPVTLAFAKAGKIEAKVRVEAPGAAGHQHDMGAGHEMGHMHDHHH